MEFNYEDNRGSESRLAVRPIDGGETIFDLHSIGNDSFVCTNVPNNKLREIAEWILENVEEARERDEAFDAIPVGKRFGFYPEGSEGATNFPYVKLDADTWGWHDDAGDKRHWHEAGSPWVDAVVKLELTPQQQFDALEVGDKFTFQPPGSPKPWSTNRVKVNKSQYFILGESHLYTFGERDNAVVKVD